MSKKTICLDFDGVVHSYTSPWIDASFIPDPPVPGALAFIKQTIEGHKYSLQIYSSRSHQEGGIKAMQLWFKHWLKKEYGWQIGTELYNELCKTEHKNFDKDDSVTRYLYFPISKPPAFLTIDDRAWTFKGVFPSIEEIEAFKPWNK